MNEMKNNIFFNFRIEEEKKDPVKEEEKKKDETKGKNKTEEESSAGVGDGTESEMFSKIPLIATEEDQPLSEDEFEEPPITFNEFLQQKYLETNYNKEEKEVLFIISLYV